MTATRTEQLDPAIERLIFLGRLAAGVAHDLNNYLGVVDVSLAIAQSHAREPRLHGDLQRARAAMEAAIRLTGSLLDHARGGTCAPAPVDLGALVRRTLEVFGRAIPVDVQVSLAVEDPIRPVLGVTHELEQLVLNLVLNACDAMPGGGLLDIGVAAAGDAGVMLEVADTGTGFPDHVGEIDPTSGLSPSTKAGHPGGGLGLGIVRSVTDRHEALLRFGARSGGGTRAMVVFSAAQLIRE